MNERLYTKTRVPGADIFGADLKDGSIIYQEISTKEFVLSLKVFEFKRNVSQPFRTVDRPNGFMLVDIVPAYQIIRQYLE